MALKDMLGAVNTILTGNGTLPNATPLELTPSIKANRAVPVRVSWVPATHADTYEASGTPQVRRAALVAGPPPERSLCTRWAAVECHLWAGGLATADDYSAVEALLSAVISAIHQTSYGVYRLMGGGVVVKGTEAANLGHRIVLLVSFAIPIVEVQQNNPALPTTATITTVTQDTGMNFPDGSTVHGSPGT